MMIFQFKLLHLQMPLGLLRTLCVAALTAIAMPCALSNPTESGLIGHWTFDKVSDREILSETGSPALEIPETAGKRDVISGEELPVFTPQFVEGKIGKAIGFSSPEQGWLGLPKFDAIGLPADQTWSFWLKVPDPNQKMVVLSTMDGPRDPNPPDQPAGWIIYVRGWQLRVDAVDSEGQVHRLATPAASILADEWQHIAVVFGQDQISLYVDGEKLTEDAFPGGATLSPNASLVVGNYNWIGGFRHSQCPAFGGCLDDLKLFSRALAPEEVAQLATIVPKSK